MTATALVEPVIYSRTGDVGFMELLTRIRSEYAEMPGLKLTPRQARRLWTVDDAACEAALATLVDAKFLFRTPEGLFALRGRLASA